MTADWSGASRSARRIITVGGNLFPVRIIEEELLHHLTLEREAFQEFVDQAHHYKDKFVARLDSDEVMGLASPSWIP